MTECFLDGNPWEVKEHYLAILPDPDTVIRIQEFRRHLFSVTGNASYRILLPILPLASTGKGDFRKGEEVKKKLKMAIEKCKALPYIRIIEPAISGDSLFIEIITSLNLSRLQGEPDDQPISYRKRCSIPRFNGFFLGYLEGHSEGELEKIKGIFKEKSGLADRELKKFHLVEFSMSFDEFDDFSSYNWEYTILGDFRIKKYY